MLKTALVLFFNLLLFASASADDILIPFGQNAPGAPSWKYKGGGTNLNAVSWKSLAYAETGWLTGTSAFGFGSGPTRNTTIPEDNSAGGGGPVGARYPTMYFRKVINIPSVAVYTSFQIKAQFDDAIVIWVNGVEAYRNNIGASPAYATLATAAISNNGNDIYTASINSSMFVNGNNIIAVEIHQNSLTSSDLFFDMELKGITSPPDVTIFPFGSNNAGAPSWRYKGGGTNLDAVSWKSLGYAEPSWVTGNAALGFGGGPARNTNIPENTTAGGGGNAGSRYPTMYFRKVVNIANPSTFAGFRFDMKFDDGIVVYLNGLEIYRNNVDLPGGYSSWSPSAIANNGADIYSTIISKSKFVAGNNIIAVEIHQNSASSTDLFFDMALTGLNSSSINLVRGPYLQMGGQSSINIRWRTDFPSDSKVTYGNAFGTYTYEVTDATDTTEHEVTLTGLDPDTKYWYTVGSTTDVLEATVNNYFKTLPTSTPGRKVQILAFGDCGNNSTNQANVRDAFINYANANNIEPDAWILMGDNAYSSGTDAEYTSGFFNVYKNTFLRNLKLYPSPGNHDYGNNSANKGSRTMPYYLNFTTPENGELGGVPSNRPAYYSFDIGDIHFLSLDSYGRENGNTTHLYDTAIGNAQADWLRLDLAANTRKWTVAYFHHPPYTKTSHTSDTESDLIAIRERLVRILERYGVDLVICGHAHGYERSYLLKGYYNTFASPILDANFNAALHTATGNTRNGKYDGSANSCAYVYNSGKYNHGSVYMVAGSAGQLGGSASGYPHDCMYYSDITNGGSFYFEVDSNRLDAKFISYSGSGATVSPVIRDQFTIFKDVNKTHNLAVQQGTPLTLEASWPGTYLWPNNGNATSRNVVINNNTVGNFVYTVRDNQNCIQDVFNVTVSTVLPVQLTNFTATLDRDIVQLRWITEREINNHSFTIERSSDGVNYTVLGTIPGAGNSSESNTYRMTDYMPGDGVNYYRLSQTDIDGVRRHIEVERVNYRSSSNFKATVVNVSPGNLNVAIRNVHGGQVYMKVLDITGREILTRSFNTGSDPVYQTLQLRKGVYVLHLANTHGDIFTTKIISD